LLRHELLTFQRGSHPHISLINALHTAGVDDKHVHAVSSISALTLLAKNGFGISTLPRRVAEQLGPDTQVCILETALPLAPLPLHASYWNTLTNPFLKQSIQEALATARRYGTQKPATPNKRSGKSAANQTQRD
jgi:DNA-binding transcriptional LysR family regulator